MKKIMKVLALIAGLTPALAFAAWPTGQYTLTFYADKGTPYSGTQGICIVTDGTWYSTTFSGWSGKWYLKGNELHMHGNYSAGAGNDAFELDRIAGVSLVTGYWQEWRDDGSFDNYVTAKFTRTSSTCAAAASQSSPVPNPQQGGGK